MKLEVIGVRHGEKRDETLASREELARASDFGDFFRIPIDAQDLEYALYVSEGELCAVQADDFNSANAPRLSVPEILELLLTLPEIRAELALRDPVLSC